MRRKRAAPVAADRDQRQPLGGGRVARREDVGRGKVEQRLDDRIGERGEPLGAALALAILLEALANEPAAVRQHFLQQVEHRLARGGGIGAALRADRSELRLQPVLVDGAFRWFKPLHLTRVPKRLRAAARLAWQSAE